MQNINNIYYINLAHRVARDEQFLNEMRYLDIPESKINRIEATYHSDFGIYGCCCSHIDALQAFIASGDSYTIIFEDDFKLMVEPSIFHQTIQRIFDESVIFDLILLEGAISSELPSEYNYLNRVLRSCGTAGYMITREFTVTLLENFKECRQIFDTRDDWIPGTYYPEICLDLHWHVLQQKYLFYISQPVFGCQRQGYSDIQKRILETDHP